MPDDPISPTPRFARGDDTHTDGNELAGLLAEVFGADMTSAPRRCADCGLDAPLAAHRAYHGAGVVLRCPGCDAVALRLGVFEDRITVLVGGVLTVPRR